MLDERPAGSDPPPRPTRPRRLARVATDVKRVCLLGAESTGKTTLAAALAERFGTVWNPEYGRPYTQIGRPADAPWTSWEFTHIARIQCWYEDFLAGLARPRPVHRHRRVHDGGVPRGLPGNAGDRVRRARAAPVRPVPRLRARCPVEPRRHQGVRVATAVDARALPPPGAGERQPVAPRRGAGRRAARRRGGGAWSRCWPAASARRCARRRRSFGTKLAQNRRQDTATSSDRIASGWWVGVPRRKPDADFDVSARSGARPSSAP